MNYTADFIYETKRLHTKMEAHMEFLDLGDVTNYLTSFTEWLNDYDYVLLRADIHYIKKEDPDEIRTADH